MQCGTAENSHHASASNQVLPEKQASHRCEYAAFLDRMLRQLLGMAMSKPRGISRTSDILLILPIGASEQSLSYGVQVQEYLTVAKSATKQMPYWTLAYELANPITLLET